MLLRLIEYLEIRVRKRAYRKRFSSRRRVVNSTKDILMDYIAENIETMRDIGSTLDIISYLIDNASGYDRYDVNRLIMSYKHYSRSIGSYYDYCGTMIYYK